MTSLSDVLRHARDVKVRFHTYQKEVVASFTLRGSVPLTDPHGTKYPNHLRFIQELQRQYRDNRMEPEEVEELELLPTNGKSH